jgi:hypothetical protein
MENQYWILRNNSTHIHSNFKTQLPSLPPPPTGQLIHTQSQMMLFGVLCLATSLCLGLHISCKELHLLSGQAPIYGWYSLDLRNKMVFLSVLSSFRSGTAPIYGGYSLDLWKKMVLLSVLRIWIRLDQIGPVGPDRIRVQNNQLLPIYSLRWSSSSVITYIYPYMLAYPQRGQCVLISVVFTHSTLSHHGSV